MKRSGIRIEQATRNAIREKYRHSNLSISQVAEEFGVSDSTVFKIIHENHYGSIKTTKASENSILDTEEF